MELMFYAHRAVPRARSAGNGSRRSAAASIALRLARRISGCRLPALAGALLPDGAFPVPARHARAHRALPFVARLPKAVGLDRARSRCMAFIVAFRRCYRLTDRHDRCMRWARLRHHRGRDALHLQRVQGQRASTAGSAISPIRSTCRQLFVIGVVLTFEPPFGMWIGIFGTVAMSIARAAADRSPGRSLAAAARDARHASLRPRRARASVAPL